MTAVRDCFDKRFKIILNRDILKDHVEMMLWINDNSSGNVQVKLLKSQKLDNKWIMTPVGKDRAFVAFEDEADALIFKIKYL